MNRHMSTSVHLSRGCGERKCGTRSTWERQRLLVEYSSPLSAAAASLSYSVLSLWIGWIMASQQDLDKALIKAARGGKLYEIQPLLDQRAYVNAVDSYYYTPLHWASYNGHHQCVELLLDRQANINAVTSNNNTALHWASRNGHHQCAKLLIDRGADISLTDVRDLARDARDTSLHLLLI